jgi:transcriptional regulator with XRE-family HTH domain
MKEVHKQKYTKLGLKISYYRKLRGLTQEQFAEKLDKNLAFIGAVEAPNMARTISLDTLFDMAEVLDVPPHRFIQFDDE